VRPVRLLHAEGFSAESTFYIPAAVALPTTHKTPSVEGLWGYRTAIL